MTQERISGNSAVAVQGILILVNRLTLQGFVF
jgi:hypothetical protein